MLFTSLHNNPSLRQMVTLDFPVRNVVMRVGYVCDIQQAKVNNLKSHTYFTRFYDRLRAQPVFASREETYQHAT